MDGDEEPLKRLGQRIGERRRALGLTLRRATEVAGLGSRNTWSAAEDGTRAISETNYAKIERALQWAPGSVGRVLDGREPTVLTLPRVSYAHDNVGLSDSVSASVVRNVFDDDLRLIDQLPISATRKLELMRQYLRLVKEAEVEASEGDGTAEAG
jgi:hypothetical protein